MQSQLFSAALQNSLTEGIVSLQLHLWIILWYKSAGTQHQCTAALLRTERTSYCSVLVISKAGLHFGRQSSTGIACTELQASLLCNCVEREALLCGCRTSCFCQLLETCLFVSWFVTEHWCKQHALGRYCILVQTCWSNAELHKVQHLQKQLMAADVIAVKLDFYNRLQHA